MKICHITCAHSRYDVRIFEKECRSLAKNGNEIYLIVNDDKPDEELHGVKIVSTGFVPHNRFERFIKSAQRILDKALRIDAEIYHLHDPELLRIVKVLLNNNKKVIFDAHEDTEEQIRDKEWIPSVFRNSVSKLYAQYAYRKMSMAQGVITVTPQLVEKFKKYNENTVMVTNYPISNQQQIESKFQIKAKNYVFFAGGISKQWCHEYIAQAINKLGNVQYVIAGKSDAQYIDKIKDINANIHYLGMISHQEVSGYYQNSLAGMAILKCAQVGSDGTLGNTKLFEIMQSGKPVICSDLKLWRGIVEKYNCGICVESNNIDEIANAIRYIESHPIEAEQMGKNGKRAIEQEYNWESQEKELIGFYNKIGFK